MSDPEASREESFILVDRRSREFSKPDTATIATYPTALVVTIKVDGEEVDLFDYQVEQLADTLAKYKRGESVASSEEEWAREGL